MVAHDCGDVERAGRQAGEVEGRASRPHRRPDRVGKIYRGARAILVGVGEIDDLAPFRRTITGLAGIGEEGNRRLGADQHEFIEAFEERDDLLAEIRQALDDDAAGARLGVGGKSVAQEPRAGLGLDAARRLQRLADERRPAQQHRRPLAAGE